MPQIFDNIEQSLTSSTRTDHGPVGSGGLLRRLSQLCRGWRSIDKYVERWSGGEGHCCRLLVGMHQLPHEEFRVARSLAENQSGLDNQKALQLKKRLAEEFKEQLATGAPSNEDEKGLRRLANTDQGKESRRKAVPQAYAARQAIPPVSPGSLKPDHRLPREQQPHPVRTLQTG